MGWQKVKKKLRKPDGKLNWKFILIGSSTKKFLLVTLWAIAICLMAYGYDTDRQKYMDVYQNPCKYCHKISYVDKCGDNIFGPAPEIKIKIGGEKNATKKRDAFASQNNS